MKHPNKAIMQKAIDYARKHHTVGAVVIKGNKVLVESGGTIFSGPDATGHSEINAIRKACKKLKSDEMEGCWVYTTFEPCAMCSSALIWANVEGIVYGASMEDQTDHWRQRTSIKTREVIKRSNRKPVLIEEFMRKECKRVMDDLEKEDKRES
jgi:guanine deaminase